VRDVRGSSAIEMVTRRVQTRMERKRTGPRMAGDHPSSLTDERTLELVPRVMLPITMPATLSLLSDATHGAAVPFQEPSLAELARVIKAAPA